MKQKTTVKMKKSLIIYFVIVALTALAVGLSDSVFSNYFKDAYNVDAFQRGLIEFPRELPGLLCVFIMAMLSFLGDIKIAILAQIASAFGMMVLGLTTPTFTVMLIFLFINSLGMHLFFPLQDSIGMALVKEGESIGKSMGQYKAVGIAFTMLSSIMVFFGFRSGVFSFTANIKWIFVISSVIFVAVFILFLYLNKLEKGKDMPKPEKLKIVFHKEYTNYYILAIMHGAQKQIMAVFGPWVLIDILSKKADTLAVLGMVGSFIGIFFMFGVGKWLDRFGVKKMLYADALSYIGVYIAYGLVSAGLVSGSLPTIGIPVFIVFTLFILDRMSMQLGMVKVVYLRMIARDAADITPTLSLGISMDHVVSIICAYLGGLVWSSWGPQYIFFLAAALSVVNLVVATRVVEKQKTTEVI